MGLVIEDKKSSENESTFTSQRFTFSHDAEAATVTAI